MGKHGIVLNKKYSMSTETPLSNTIQKTSKLVLYTSPTFLHKLVKFIIYT